MEGDATNKSEDKFADNCILFRNCFLATRETKTGEWRATRRTTEDNGRQRRTPEENGGQFGLETLEPEHGGGARSRLGCLRTPRAAQGGSRGGGGGQGSLEKLWWGLGWHSDPQRNLAGQSALRAGQGASGVPRWSSRKLR